MVLIVLFMLTDVFARGAVLSNGSGNNAEYDTANIKGTQIISDNESEDLWDNYFNSDNYKFDIDYKCDLVLPTYSYFGKHLNYIYNISANLDMDLYSLFGIKNAHLYTQILGIKGADLTGKTGVYQGISNIDAPDNLELYQCFVEKSFANDKLSLLLGLYDLNSEFDTRASSSNFIIPSQGIGPEFAFSGKNGPSIFPYTSFALRIKYAISDKVKNLVGLFDGVPGNPSDITGTHLILSQNDGVLFIDEINYLPVGDELKEGYSKLGAGAWFYSSKFQNLETTNSNEPELAGNFGVYFYGEKFFKINGEENSNGISVFLRTGFSNYLFNKCDFYLGGGITCNGNFIGKDNEIGLSFASAHIQNNYNPLLKGRNISFRQFETDVELYYKFTITDYLFFQPDVQLIFNPGQNQSASKEIFFISRIGLNI